MARRQLSEEALDMISHRFKALGDPLRLRLIMALMDGSKNVGQLVDELGATQANVSRHLQLLADNGIVNRKKKGLHVFYSIADPSVFELCDLVCGSVEKFLRKQTRAFRSPD